MKAPLPILALLMLMAVPGWANDTAINAGDCGPEPFDVLAGEESPIRMMAEELVFRFGKEKTRVTARFHFLNTTAAPISQKIGFPDAGAGLDWTKTEHTFEPLLDMKSFVDGKETQAKLEHGWVYDSKGFYEPVHNVDVSKMDEYGRPVQPPVKTDANGKKSYPHPMGWHTLEVVFPPGKEVMVERQYETRNGGCMYVTFFTYTVHTGAAWKGTIGALKARVYLEDGLQVNDVFFGGDMLGFETSPGRKAWKIISKNEMTLDWTDFKPTQDLDKRQIVLSYERYDGGFWIFFLRVLILQPWNVILFITSILLLSALTILCTPHKRQMLVVLFFHIFTGIVFLLKIQKIWDFVRSFIQLNNGIALLFAPAVLVFMVLTVLLVRSSFLSIRSRWIRWPVIVLLALAMAFLTAMCYMLVAFNIQAYFGMW